MLRNILFYFNIVMLIVVKGNDKYGKFELIVNNFYEIKGPKHNNCTQSSMGVVNHTTVFYDMKVITPTRITHGKIIAKAHGKNFLRIQMKNPCQHIFLSNIFMTTFNMTKTCYVEKGTFRSTIDINNIALQYYGGSFVYGNLTFQTMLLAGDCNFSCTNIDVTIYPRT